MLNFIVCEDNKVILQKNIDIINKIMFGNDIDYKVYSFLSYNDDLKKLINESENNIYVLDIELEEISGIDIAREIRNKDFKSIIIISTTHIDYLPYAIKSKLAIFDYISKFEEYELNLTNSIKRAISICEHVECKKEEENGVWTK